MLRRNYMARRKLAQVSDMTIKDSFDEYITHCQAKSLKQVTIDGYRRNYQYFIDWLGDDTQPIKTITKSILESFILHLQNNTSRNNVSINTTLRSIRSWLNYCSNQDYIPHISIPYLKENSQPKEIYSHDDLQKLLTKPNLNHCTFAEYRNWVIVSLFVSTGIRRHSLTNIKIEDVDFESGLIKLTAMKSSKTHYVNMSHKLATILKEYLKYRQGSLDDWLFVTEKNTKLQDDNLTNSIYQYNKSRGVSVTSIHSFRHTYAINYMRSVSDIFRLSKQLQHSSITITQQYLKALEGEEIAKSNDFDLLDKL